MSDRTILRADGLTIGYRRAGNVTATIASDLRFSLRSGELVCLLGPNGAGKSTLMRTLARLQPSLSGHIWLDHRQLDALRPGQLARRLSVVLTEKVDVGAMTGYVLASLGRLPYTGWTGTLGEEDRRIVHWALEAVSAQDLADRLIVEMSDGERQKIFIARALAQEPRLMLLDEPTAFLDLPRRVEVMDLLRRLAQENGQAILLSTHDLDLALRNADRLWLLSAEGKLYDGAPEDLVLSGAFERVFSAEGVTFDRHSGSFHTRQQACGRLRLQGDGVAAFWTRRALERIGFAVEEEPPARRSSSAGTGMGLFPKGLSDVSEWCVGTQREGRPVGSVRPRSSPAVSHFPEQLSNGGERAGGRASEREALPVVSVGSHNETPVYRLESTGKEERFESLDALTTYLRGNGAGGAKNAQTDENLYPRR